LDYTSRKLKRLTSKKGSQTATRGGDIKFLIGIRGERRNIDSIDLRNYPSKEDVITIEPISTGKNLGGEINAVCLAESL